MHHRSSVVFQYQSLRLGQAHHMRRRTFITLLGSTALVRPVSAQGTAEKAPSMAGRGDVDVRRDFGAKGDGVTDDWRAIENAGLYLEKLGGGRMYFPAGHYKLPNFGFNVRTRSNIEYCGDGHASWIDATNCCFCNTASDSGLVFTV